MKKIDFKKDLKKMALAGIMSGAMLIAQSAGAAQVSSDMDNYIAAAKCGAGSCGSSPSTSYKSSCGGQPTSSSSSSQRNPRLNRQIAENDMMFSDVETQKSQETPTSVQSPSTTQKPASSAWQNQKSWESSQKPSNGHSCSGKSGCSSSNGSYQNMPRTAPVQGQPQSYNQRSSNRQVAESDGYYYPSQPSASCAARPTYSQPSASSCAARPTYSQPSTSSCSGRSSCRAPTSGSGCAGK
ncbi:hypothetical protein [Criblamydia sequanensis]|uniref:Secreted protein n=1 Tax=Candidatus Criblamydia sequanensis CRIB-18 TaxID=1437425 RepID=A0A090D2L4_9BACT|nr:hypothetical protein [Criblamydia sequanensis]CDR34473.1 putative secreted protein [Criblamydia sequanensis CRIB-18]